MLVNLDYAAKILFRLYSQNKTGLKARIKVIHKNVSERVICYHSYKDCLDNSHL